MAESKITSEEWNPVLYHRSYFHHLYTSTYSEPMNSPVDTQTTFASDPFCLDFCNPALEGLRRHNITNNVNNPVMPTFLFPGFSDFERIELGANTRNYNIYPTMYNYQVPFQSNFTRLTTDHHPTNSTPYFSEPYCHAPKFMPNSNTELYRPENEVAQCINPRRHSLPDLPSTRVKNQVIKSNSEEVNSRRRITNRSAAFRSRQRKSVWVNDTRNKLHQWREQNGVLSDQVTQLQEKLIQIYSILNSACSDCKSVLKDQKSIPVDYKTIDVNPDETFTPWGSAQVVYVPKSVSSNVSNNMLLTNNSNFSNTDEADDEVID